MFHAQENAGKIDRDDSRRRFATTQFHWLSEPSFNRRLAAWINDWLPDIQVILISGLDMESSETRNGWSFFRKPLDLGLIQQAIEICQDRPSFTPPD